MLIDWFTVAVQIVNFLVLIALLKRFLYGPIVRALDERQQAIADSLSTAALVKQEAEAQLTALAEEKEALASSREALMLQAVGEVESWRQATLIRFKEEVEERRRIWQRQLTEEQLAFFDKLKVRLGKQVVLVAGKVLSDMADYGLEARILDLFLAKMAKDQPLADGEARPAPSVILVTTGLALTPEGREGLRHQLTSQFGSGEPIVFTEEPGLGFGIRLTIDDQAWEWNLAHYMRGLEQDIRQAMTLVRESGETDE